MANINKDINIFISCHKEFFVPECKYFVPVFVGSALSDKTYDMVRDDSGDNISSLNKSLCELTAVYWANKNVDCKYYGLYHYRRYFLFEPVKEPLYLQSGNYIVSEIADRFNGNLNDRLIFNRDKFNNVVGKADIVLPKKIIFDTNLYSQYIVCPQHGQDDVTLLIEIAKKKCPKFVKFIVKAFNSPFFYPFNMFIMKKEILDDYCNTVLPLVIEFSKLFKTNNSIYSSRKPGMLSERMMAAFVLYEKSIRKRFKVKELDVVQINDPINTKLIPANKEKNAILLSNDNPFFKNTLVQLNSIIKNCSDSNRDVYDIVILGEETYRKREIINRLTQTKRNISVRFWPISKSGNPVFSKIISEDFSLYNQVAVIKSNLLFFSDIKQIFNSVNLNKPISATKHIDIDTYLPSSSALKEHNLAYDGGLFVVRPNLLKSIENVIPVLNELYYSIGIPYSSTTIDFVDKLDLSWNCHSFYTDIPIDIFKNVINLNDLKEVKDAFSSYKCVNYRNIDVVNRSEFSFYLEYQQAFNSLQYEDEIKQTAKNGLKNKLLPYNSLRRYRAKKTLKKQFYIDKNFFKKQTKRKYNLENPVDIQTYKEWLKKQKFSKNCNSKIFFSIVIPVYNTIHEQLIECIESVLNQTYRNFELILVDDKSTFKNVVQDLEKYEGHPKVKIVYKPENGGISLATNEGLKIAKGEFIVFMDCDDLIDKHALNEVAVYLEKHPNCDFVYTDEDKITEDGVIRHLPFFKPDWSPDLFYSMMYTNHLGVYRHSIVKKALPIRKEFDGAQDYDFTLRFLNFTSNDRIGHIPNVLYHWRERKESIACSINAKSKGIERAKLAKIDYFRGKDIDIETRFDKRINQDIVVFLPKNNPLVSIIIPSKDHPEILERLLKSIKTRTNYTNYELIVVDNGSSQINLEKLKKLQEVYNFTHLFGEYDFNFSKMCNLGYKHAKGEILLFLNDDIVVGNDKDWLTILVGQAQQQHTGCVGCKLFFPKGDLIQHAGVCSYKEGPGHVFYNCSDNSTLYFGFNRVAFDCLCVTAACLAIRKQVFKEVGCFDETFPTVYNDVELNFKVHKKGYYNVCRNDVCLYHHESLSRGRDQLSDKKMKELLNYKERLYEMYPDYKENDPFVNKNLSYYSSVLLLKGLKTKKPSWIRTFIRRHPKLLKIAKRILRK